MKQVPTNIEFRMNDTWVKYRATAYEYMKRFGITSCKGSDGEYYTIEDFKNSIINYKR